MKFPSARARIRPNRTTTLTTLAAACALAGCSSPSGVPGSPVLTQVYWAAGGEQVLAWSLDPSVAMVSPVPPFGAELDFVFDRRLDGTKIEDFVTVNGVMTTQPKDTPAIRVTWPDMGTVMSDPPFHLVVDYNSIPRYGGASSYLIAKPDVPGFPASDTLTFQLVPALVTGESNEPAVLPSSIAIRTGAFSVSIGTSTLPVAASYQVPLNFSNRLPAVLATSPQIHVRTHGADVPYKLLADSSLGSRWYLAAADCLGGWPASTTFDVTIDADFVDAFGDKLGQPATATFSTSAGAAAVAATCSVPDAGASDTGATPPVDGGADAPADAPVDIAAAPSLDASIDVPDAGVEASADAPPSDVSAASD
jgi:hypothetical protein